MIQNTCEDPDLIGPEVIGSKMFYWRVRNRHSDEVFIYALNVSSRGSLPTQCFSMTRSGSTGQIKIKTYGSWKLTLDQYEWISSKCIELLRG